jgi:hypothetical protein
VSPGLTYRLFTDFGGTAPTYTSAVGAPSDHGGSVTVFPRDFVGQPAFSRGTLLRQGDRPVGGDPEAEESFGAAIAQGDFDGDGWTDLAIGAPGDRVDGVRSGSVTVVHGQPDGYARSVSQRITLDSPGVPGRPSNSDRFGVSLAVTDLEGDGYDDLAVGVPGFDADDQTDAGAVVILRGGPGGLRGFRLLTQDRLPSPGEVESGDGFGAALAADRWWLIVGAPGEDVGDAADAGTAVALHLLSRTQFDLKQPGRNETEGGDQFGAALAASDGVVIVGSPGEDRPGRADTGMVTLAFVPNLLGRNVLQSDLYSGVDEAGDQFGATVALVTGAGGSAYLFAVGAPGEDLGSAVDAGDVLLGPEKYLPINQETTALPDFSERGDGFGSMVTFADGNLLVGAPGEDIGSIVDAGAAWWIGGEPFGQLIVQGVGGVPGAPQAGDQFGWSGTG